MRAPVVRLPASITPQKHKTARCKKGRSAAQREWTAAVASASRAWEHLTDEQRLSWNLEGQTRRTSGQRYFVKINAPRFRDGQEMLTALPRSELAATRRILKRLVITTRHDQLTLQLEVSPVPNGRFIVWGSRPCNQGISAYHKCPRLGPLPAHVNGWCDITGLYFRKHGASIKAKSVQVVGKRIVIHLRQELDAGPTVYQEVRALVYRRRRVGQAGQKEAESYGDRMEILWNNTLPPRPPAALHGPATRSSDAR